MFNESNGYLSVFHMNDRAKDEVGTVESKDTGTTPSSGMIGKARHFGVGKGINCGEKITTYPTGSSPHTSEAWFMAEQPNATVLAWGNEAGQGKVMVQYFSPPHMKIECYFSGADVPGGSALATSQWVHVVHAFKNGDSRVYVNGVLDGVSTSKGAPLAIKSPARMYIGGWYDNYRFVGDIDEVRIFKVTRSADWVRLQYENQKPLQTVVGPLVQAGTDFSVSEERISLLEGKSAAVSGKAGGAQKVYWILKRGDKQTIAAVDRFHFTLDAGRVTGDQSLTLEFKAVYPDDVKTLDIPVTIREDVPEPVFALQSPVRWDGREPIEVVPQISNLQAMQAKGAGNLKFDWTVSGLAVIKEVAPGKLILKRAQNSGTVTVSATVSNGGKLAGSDTATGPGQHRLVLNLKEKKLWEPGSPFLYDLKLTLFSGKEKIDELRSYFGLRHIAIDGRKILINGKPVFQRLILDQGFYPEGIWTAPSDEALKKAIEMSMACGYNGARLHQKVFEPRFLYWADKLGYLVWGEYPNAGYGNQREGFSAVVNEWTEILLRDRNHPSIIGWCAFNENFEGSGELQQMIWTITKAVDPTRPALEASGWAHRLPHPEVRDAHDYSSNPKGLRKKWMDYFSAPTEGPLAPARYLSQAASQTDCGVPFMISEIGGIGWATEGGWSYGAGPKTLDEFYARYKGTIAAMLDNPNLFGFCYTQLTDIEQERNGLYYYDRKPKFDAAKLHAITSRQAAYERGEAAAPRPSVKIVDAKWKVLVGAVQDGKMSTPYKYVIEKPADNWITEGFDDSAWKSGLAPFSRGGEKRTEWNTPEIYFRQTFEYDDRDLKNGAVVIRHNDSTEIYINGQKILGVKGSRGYYMVLVTAVTKSGTGTWTLSGINSYTGPTKVTQGTLALANALTLGDKADVYISEGATLGLNFQGEVKVRKLTLGGTVQAAGTYSAAHVPKFIKGTGSLVFAQEPVTRTGQDTP
ncbi:MAG: autotransporter-associated beta strand repeat-containing protein [Planctomycetota bacterium]|nr:autotransporter-associated beta strand repeat-containing protein [Planctomycetota bacterium]